MSSTRPAASPPSVASVSRALALLDALAASPRAMRLSELARAVQVNPSTASRLLATLARHGLVERSPQGSWRLGLGLLTLSDRVLERLDVRERARPWLAWLVEQTGETATLSLPGAEAAITVDFVPSPASVVSMARVGRPSVPHATATGKVMLALGPQAQWRSSDQRPHGSRGAEAPSAISGPLVRFTERTICDPRALEAELARVREQGYAEAIGEREADLTALAAPILGRSGELVAIIGLQGPTARLPAAKRQKLRAPLLRACAEVARALGAPG